MTQSDIAKAAAEDVAPRIDPATVPGWGVDADPENDPTWPMRDRAGEDGAGMSWTRPPLQNPDVEILQSLEHDGMTAVLGTSTPPSGLSGVLRRQAFKLSEGQWGHWLMLMAADRMNVVEGMLQDVGNGRSRHPFPGEQGASRSRTRAVVTTAAVGAGLLGAIWLVRRRRR